MHALAVSPRDQPTAVVLDLMHPQLADGVLRVGVGRQGSI